MNNNSLEFYVFIDTPSTYFSRDRKHIFFFYLFQLHYAVAMGRGVLCPAPYPPGGLSLAALAALHQDRLLTKNSSIADLRLKAKKHAEAISRDQEIV